MNLNYTYLLALHYLPALITSAILVASIIVCRKRKEAGFIVLSAGIGINLLLSLFTNSGTWANDMQRNHPVLMQLFWASLGLFPLLGWTMLARKKA